MADIQYSSHLLGKQAQSGPNVTWGSFIAAAALALLIGLSAADIQKQHLAGVEQGQSSVLDASRLDGRGKWGGYM